MNNSKKIFLILTIFATAVIAGIIIIKESKKIKQSSTEFKQEQEQVPQKTDDAEKEKLIMEVKKDYEYDIKTLISQYNEINDLDKEKEQITGIKNKIFELRVPEQYKNLHLDLAINFEMLVQGLNTNDKYKVDKAKNKINTVINNNSWLITNAGN